MIERYIPSSTPSWEAGPSLPPQNGELSILGTPTFATPFSLFMDSCTAGSQCYVTVLVLGLRAQLPWRSYPGDLDQLDICVSASSIPSGWAALLFLADSMSVTPSVWLPGCHRPPPGLSRATGEMTPAATRGQRVQLLPGFLMSSSLSTALLPASPVI